MRAKINHVSQIALCGLNLSVSFFSLTPYSTSCQFVNDQAQLQRNWVFVSDSVSRMNIKSDLYKFFPFHSISAQLLLGFIPFNSDYSTVRVGHDRCNDKVIGKG